MVQEVPLSYTIYVRQCQCPRRPGLSPPPPGRWMIKSQREHTSALNFTAHDLGMELLLSLHLVSGHPVSPAPGVHLTSGHLVHGHHELTISSDGGD